MRLFHLPELVKDKRILLASAGVELKRLEDLISTKAYKVNHGTTVEIV